MSTDTIDTDECAALLRCSTDTIEEMARGGDLPGLKIGRTWLFIRQDLLAYLAEKARREADERRARRQPGVTPITSRTKRRQPPVLMTSRA